jgi:DNA polymerase-4
MTPRVILHVDLDCFFVSVERLLRPRLRGKPVVVGGTPGQRRAVVASASYEARRFGIHSAMPIARAVELCPRAVFLRGHHGLYEEYSRKVRVILERYAPIVEAASIDEFYLDLTGCGILYGGPNVRRTPRHDAPGRRPPRSDPSSRGRMGWAFRLAARLKDEILDGTGLPVSVGIASNRLLAKMASKLAKPRGLLWILAGRERAFIAPLGIGELPGVGGKTRERLRRMGLRTIADLARFPEELLSRVFGSHGSCLAEMAKGIDRTPVEDTGREMSPRAARKSLGHEVTLEEDTADPAALHTVLSGLAERCCHRLRSGNRVAGKVTLKLRYEDFVTVTRRTTIPPTDDDIDVYHAARALLRRAYQRRIRVRLLGISLSRLAPARAQGTLFGDSEREKKTRLLLACIDGIRKRFGFDAIARASAHQRTGKTTR